MARWRSSLKAVSLAPVLAAALAAAQGVVVPAGTELELRLAGKVSSASSRPGDAVEAKVVAAVPVDGQFVIPAGATVRGRVVEARPAPGSDRRAILWLAFPELLLEGRTVPLLGAVTRVDNARESVDPQGRILGILASETLAAQMDAGIAKVAERYAGLADLLGAAKQSMMRNPDSEISYEAGTELIFTLTQPVTVTPPANAVPRLELVEDSPALLGIAQSQPFRTMAQSRPPKPSDITNLMFIGSEEALTAAFEAAGWTGAAALTAESALETFRAIAELRGYKEAPMSTLLLDGRPPDLVFQKQLNTFAMRHHLRIWKRPVSYGGQTVWVCAATHDTGIEFSPENRTFIHTIDPHIDRERAKVVNDLLLSGRVRSLALVERAEVPKRSSNATGDELITDGRIAVLILR